MATDRVSDELLATAYLRLRQEGLLRYIFYAGEPSLYWFLDRYAKTKSTEVIACFKEDENRKLEMVGLSWFNSREKVANLYDKAECGNAYFRKFHNYLDTTKAARLMTEFSFRYLGIDALFGCTPEKNRAAMLLAKRVGFEVWGPVPMYTAWEGEPCGAWISCLTRARWEELKNHG